MFVAVSESVLFITTCINRPHNCGCNSGDSCSIKPAITTGTAFEAHPRLQHGTPIPSILPSRGLACVLSPKLSKCAVDTNQRVNSALINAAEQVYAKDTYRDDDEHSKATRAASAPRHYAFGSTLVPNNAAILRTCAQLSIIEYCCDAPISRDGHVLSCARPARYHSSGINHHCQSESCHAYHAVQDIAYDG